MRKAAWALLSLGWLALGCEQPVTVESSSLDAGRGELLELVARGYYPGRSGQIFFIPEPGEIFLRKPMGYYRFMHGSPWEYDRHIPMILYGPGFVAPGDRAERVHQQDVAPTLLSLVDLPPVATMSGRPLDFVFRPRDERPRVMAVVVLDGMRADYLERHADALPTLERMRRGGAFFENAWVNYVPSVTSAGHTTIATGTGPRIHGIAGNGLYDRTRGGYATLFENLDPANVMALGLADLWNLATDGEAVIITQGTTPRATVSLAGHGRCTPNGRPTILAMFDYRSGGWVTNPDCYVLPDYLDGANARDVWEKAGGRWRDLEIDDGRAFVTTALFPGFQADALVTMLRREGVGGDTVTDVVLVNFKTPDYVGHSYGPDSEEMREALAALDEGLGRFVEALEAAAGDNGYLIAVTADHGMPSEPEGPEPERRFIREVVASIHEALDPDERRLLFEFLDTANHQLYVNEKRLRELGLELADVAAFVESLPYVRAAFGEDEVRAIAIR